MDVLLYGVGTRLILATHQRFWSALAMQLTSDQFDKLYKTTCRGLLAWLSREFPVLSTEDVEDMIQETFKDVWKMSERNAIDPNRPINSLVFGIAKNRAIDLTRKKARQIRTVPLPDDDEALASTAKAIADTTVGENWKRLAIKNKAEEVTEVWQQVISSTKGMQADVARTMALDFDLKADEVAALLSSAGKPTSKEQVETAKIALRKKFKALWDREEKKQQ